MKRLYILTLFFLLIIGGIRAERINVVTINVWSGLTYKGIFSMKPYEDRGAREFRHDLLKKELLDLAPDIIGLNEANPLPSYAGTLAEDLNMAYIHHVGLGGVRIGPVGLPVNLREGDVILAREDLELEYLGRKALTGGAVGNFFTFHFGDATQIVAGKIRVGGREVFIFITHWRASPQANRATLSDMTNRYLADKMDADEYLKELRDAVKGSELRMQEARRTLDYINELAGESPVILMGDFNAQPGSPEIKFLIDGGFRDAWAGKGGGYTWDEARNTNIIQYQLPEDATGTRRERIDYIFIRGDGIRVISSSLVFASSTYNVHPSDHFGLRARLDISPASR